MRALREYLRRLDDIAPRSRANLFWQKYIDEIRVHYANDFRDLDWSRVENFARRFYGFELVASPEQDPDLLEAQQLLAPVREYATGLSAARFDASKATWEHMRALWFLEGREGMLREYLDFIGPLNVKSNMSVARHWWYARQVAELVQETQPDRALNILEIGAGAGNLAVFLHQMLRVGSYCIIDLPEILIASGYTLAERFPQVRQVYDDPQQVHGGTAFVPAHRHAEVPADSFDLALNFHSFGEMDQEARDGYLDTVYSTTRPGGLFVNVNRVQKLPQPDGTAWVNNPLLYPYRGRVLRWDEDVFMASTRNSFQGPPSLCLFRAELI
jgi:putative sugar O-methyltransferase